MIRPTAKFLMMLSAFLSTFATAEEDEIHWYQIELMLVAYTDEASFESEQWIRQEESSETDPELEPTNSENPTEPKEESLDLTEAVKVPLVFELEREQLGYIMEGMYEEGIASSESDGDKPPLLILEKNNLIPNARRFNNQKGLRTVWHQSWIEPVQEEEGVITHPVHIRTDDNPEIHIDGSFSLYVSRYLHLTTNLNVTHWAKQEETDVLEAATEEAPQTESNTPDAQPSSAKPVGWVAQTGLTATENSQIDTTANPDPLMEENEALAEAVQLPIREADILQKRRMRSGELHYIDHPLLGIVLKIIPVDAEKYIPEEPEEMEELPEPMQMPINKAEQTRTVQ